MKVQNFQVLITISQTLSTNIDCGGKPFHCLNTTHFMICVDLGGGVSSTIDDFIIPCPPTTVCEKNNRYECEFPKVEVATDLNVIGVSNVTDKSVDAITIPPDKWTTALPPPDKIYVTELPTKEKSMSRLNSDILEHLKNEFTGGNEKVFDEDIVPLSSLVDFKNSTAEITFVTPKIEENITTTDKYPHPEINAYTSNNGALSGTQTVSTLKENITFIDEPKAIKENNTGNKFNTTKEINQLYGNNTEILQHLKDEFTGGNKTFLDEDIVPLFNLVSFKNGTAEISFVTPKVEKIINTTDKYPNINVDTTTNGSLNVFQKVSTLKENITYIEETRAIKNNKTSNKVNTTKEINQLHDYELNQTLVKNFGVAELATSLPNISFKRIFNLDLDPVNSSTIPATQNLGSQKKIFQTVPMSRNNSDLTTDTISTFETVVATTSKYNDTDLGNHVIASTYENLRKIDEYSHTLQQVTVKPIEITAMNLNFPNNSEKEAVTSTDGPIIINELKNTTNELNKTKVTDRKFDFNVSENQELLNNIYDSAPILANVSEMAIDKLSITEPDLVTSPKYNGQDKVDNVIASGAVAKDLLPVKVVFAEVPLVTKINNTFNSSDIHETVENHTTTKLSTKSDSQLVLESVSPNESNNTMQNSSGFTFKMTTPSIFVNDDNIAGLKGDIELKSKENASIKDAKIKYGINKSKQVYFTTDPFNTDEIINHNMKPTMNLTNSQITKTASAFRTPLMNNSQKSATESPVKSTDEQLISIGEININNLNSFVTPTIEKPKTMVTLENDLTTFGKKYMGIESATTVDSVQKQSNFTITKYNVSIDMEAKSNSTPPNISSINIDATNETSQNTTPVLQLEAVAYSDGKGSHQVTIIGKQSEISSDTMETNKAVKAIENTDNASQLLIPGNGYNINVELSDKIMNITEQKKIVTTESASMTPNKMSTENIFVSDIGNNISKAEEFKVYNTHIQSIMFSSNMSNKENNEVKSKNMPIPTLVTIRDNMNHFENFSFYLNEATSERVSNLTNLRKVNATLLTEQKGYVTMKPLETTEMTKELDATTRHPLITESVTESINLINLSTEPSSSNNILGSTQTAMEYLNDDITLNNTEGNTNTSSSDFYPGSLISTVNPFTETNIHKTNEPSRTPTASIIDLSQAAYLSPNNETEISKIITTGSVTDGIELGTGYDRSKLLTSNATMEKLPIITVNDSLPNKTEEMIQNNIILGNVGMQSMRSDVPLSTQETIAHKSTLPTPVAVTVKKQPNIAVNHFLSSTVASNSQYNNDELIKVEKQIMNSNIENITEQVAINNLDNMSTVPTPIEATVEKQRNILENPILPSTMGSIVQPNIYELAKVETPIKSLKSSDSISLLPTSKVSTAKKEPNITVNRSLLSTMTSTSKPTIEDLAKVATLNITQSPPQKIATAILSTSNEFKPKSESNITANQISSSTVPLISKPNTEEFSKNKTVMESYNIAQSPRQVVVIDLGSMRISPLLNESTATKDPNITVKRISPSTVAISTQNKSANLELPMGNLNISQRTPQTVANDFDSKAMLLTPNEFMANESNIAENVIAHSIITSISQFDTHESDKFQIQFESSNMTQTTQETVDSNLHNTSILLMSMESIAKQRPNITVNPIVRNTMAPIIQNNTDKIVELETVSSNVTRNTNLNETSFNIVTEPATIVETINDTHNTVGRPILSDIIFGDIKLTNGTEKLKSPNQLNSGIPKKITERATLNEKLQNTTLLRNASSDLNKREDLNFDVVNVTFIDKQINIELSGSIHDNETSSENSEFSTVDDKFANQKDATSPNTPVNNKSDNNVGYKSPHSAMVVGHTGYMANSFSDLTKNITLLNKRKNIYNSTNNSESIFGINKEQQKSVINGTEAKVENLTGYKIFSKQIKQSNSSAESHMINMNVSSSLSYQMSNKSSLTTVVHLLANAKNPPRTINASKVVNTTSPVDCLKLPRGKYADSKDCQKFYICVGKLQPVVGKCPNNTVFSEINKQCTKNLSHCVRNHQFHCLYDGRFKDFLRDNVYYICVKNNKNGFLRYKLECQNGYHLNKAKVKCEENVNQSDTPLSNSRNVSIDRNGSVSKSDISENSGSIELECKKEGKFPHPKDCRKYYVCTKNSKDEYRRKIKSCSSEEIYDRKKKKCVSLDSEEG